jgi:tRNA-dihydrouridine synthase B
MNSGFWSTLAQPIIGLSPMDGITDHPFRHITKKYGNPAVMYTEFTSVEGVCHKAKQLLQDFLFDETQRPIIGQIYGTTPSFFRQTAIVLCELGFDAVDINMGCPAKNVAHSGAGAALIQTPKLAQEIIRETKAGIEDWVNGKSSRDCPDLSEEIIQEVEKRHQQLPAQYQERRALPVSIKTRIGYDQPVIHEWIPTLLEMEPAAIALHGRTLKQQYGGAADWDQIGKAAELVRKTSTLILGNGDVKSLSDAHQKIATQQLHGVLLGRATMGHPAVFLEHDFQLDLSTHEAQLHNFRIAYEHAQLFETTFSHNERYNFLPMRKHLGWYVHDLPGAGQIRQEIYRTNSSSEFLTVMHNHGYELA